ncbi:hypothetical protein [Candidatus Sarcina troglodytae]|nr:hypothetical protein [Sarcina sp. JB2]
MILFFYKFNVNPRGFHACLNKIAWLINLEKGVSKTYIMYFLEQR